MWKEMAEFLFAIREEEAKDEEAKLVNVFG
jgi:hypothetical protein